MNVVELKKLEENYRACSAIAEQFLLAVNEQLLRLLDEKKIHLGCPVEKRIKTWQSIAEKCERKTLQISGVIDLDDLVGVRLVLLFRRDVQTTCEMIENQFQIVSSEDTALRLTDEQFGYGSVHYIARFPESWMNVPTLKPFRNFKVEIQVRTLAQHMWAAASHTLQYKQESSVPPPLRRSIHRASALLETVDLEFERLLGEKDAYIKSLPDTPGDDLLNVDSLEKILDRLLPKQNKDDAIPEPFAELLTDLAHFGVTTSDHLEKLVGKHLKEVLETEAKYVKQSPVPVRDNSPRGFTRRVRGVFFTHAGLTRRVLSEAFGKKWLDYSSKKPRRVALLKLSKKLRLKG